MFTGIVQGRGEIVAITPQGARAHWEIRLPDAARAPRPAVGASVSVAGVCLTVVDANDAGHVHMDLIDETLRLTTLGQRAVGDPVNIERAATLGAEIGGHLLSGHVMGRATVVRREHTDTSLSLWLRPEPALQPYLFPKGYVGIDGCSLTLGSEVGDDGTFSLHLIPETLRVTTLGALSPGDLVNVEPDAMTVAVVATVARVLGRDRT